MARIAGINVPDNKHAGISLTYIYGIGRTTAAKICESVGIDPSVKIQDLPEDKLDAIRNEIAKMSVEGDLRREKNMAIKCQFAGSARAPTPERAKARVARSASRRQVSETGTNRSVARFEPEECQVNE